MEFDFYCDQDLFKRISQGDAEAYGVIFYRYHAMLTKVLGRYSNDPEQVKDWIQEIYLRLWENRRTMAMEGVENPKTYFMTLSRNHVLRELGRKKQIHFATVEANKLPEIADHNLEEAISHRELWQAYKIALQKMPPRTQETFFLNREGGLSYGEVANRLGISIKTVEAQVGRALCILRQELVSYV